MRREKEISEPYQPPYRVTPAIVSLVEKIGEHLGIIKFDSSVRERPDLHRVNRIKTVQGTLEIEGNTMSIGPLFCTPICSRRWPRGCHCILLTSGIINSWTAWR
ncbi:MAG: hypothetical protein ACQEQ7_02145, partial [Thermodesulfobacteriota bacterium]